MNLVRATGYVSYIRNKNRVFIVIYLQKHASVIFPSKRINHLLIMSLCDFYFCFILFLFLFYFCGFVEKSWR